MDTPNPFTDPTFKPDDAESRCETNQRLIAMRSQAFTFGFASMLGVQVVLLVLWTLFSLTDSGLLSIPVAASSTIAAGVTAAVLRYQILTSH